LLKSLNLLLDFPYDEYLKIKSHARYLSYNLRIAVNIII
jgi:hypothetical protein